MSQNKLILLAMSTAYLGLTLYLFLSSSGIEVLLLFSIFTYIFYTPLTAIFKYDIDDIEQYQISIYIKTIALTLFGVLVIYSTGFFSADTFVKILQFIVGNIPEFKVPDLMPLVKGLSLPQILLLIATALILRLYIFLAIAGALFIWLVFFVFNLFLGVVLIVLYLGISISALVLLFIIAYKGQKLTSKYVKTDFQRAIIFFSTITSALYMIAIFYINLFTLGS